MVGRKTLRIGTTLLFALFVLLPVCAENRTSVELQSLLSLNRLSQSEEWSLAGIARGSLSFESVGNRNVRAELRLDALAAETLSLELSRAYVKVRFPWFRSLFGKARLSWGEGVMFNAADLLSPQSGLATNLSAEVFYDVGTWLAEIYLPLGRFSFIELVALPPVPDLLAGLTPSIKDTSAGGRIYGKPLGIKAEAGYLYQAETDLHKPYMSFQGFLLVDLHLSAATAIPTAEPTMQDLTDNLEISGGLYHLQNINPDSSISFRLETLVRPAGDWTAEPYYPSAAAASSASGSSANRGLLLYPEIVWNASQSLSLFYRSILSPVDVSGLFALGMRWNIYQGLDVLSFASIQGGELHDLFAWGRNGDLGFTIGFDYSY